MGQTGWVQVQHLRRRWLHNNAAQCVDVGWSWDAGLMWTSCTELRWGVWRWSDWE